MPIPTCTLPANQKVSCTWYDDKPQCTLPSSCPPRPLSEWMIVYAPEKNGATDAKISPFQITRYSPTTEKDDIILGASISVSATKGAEECGNKDGDTVTFLNKSISNNSPQKYTRAMNVSTVGQPIKTHMFDTFNKDNFDWNCVTGKTTDKEELCPYSENSKSKDKRTFKHCVGLPKHWEVCDSLGKKKPKCEKCLLNGVNDDGSATSFKVTNGQCSADYCILNSGACRADADGVVRTGVVYQKREGQCVRKNNIK